MNNKILMTCLLLANTLSFAVCGADEIPKSDYREDIRYYDHYDYVERRACKEPYTNTMGITIRICESIEVDPTDDRCLVTRKYYQEAYDERNGNFNKYSVPIFDRKGRQIAKYSPFAFPLKNGDGGSLVCLPRGTKALHVSSCRG